MYLGKEIFETEANRGHMRKHAPLLPRIGFTIALISFLISVTQFIFKIPSTYLMRAMIFGEIIAILIMIAVFMELSSIYNKK